MTDSTGNATAINSYDEWGIPSPLNQGRFQYTGQAWIPELKMYYYKARIYSPTLGRFLQTDPIGYDDQINLYAYVGNDPVNMVDPTGMFAEDGKFSKWPVPGRTELNEADKPREGRGEFGTPRNTSRGPSTHSGIDIQGEVGDSVVAVDDGTVVDIKPNPSTTYGNQVVIDHGGGVYTQSAHMNSVDVKPGDEVKAGSQIGTMGRTGNTPRLGDTHLHFEVRVGSPEPRSRGGMVENPLDRLPDPE